MKNYVQPGDRLAIYNSSSTATLLAGVPVVVSGHIRIPIANISPLSWGEASAEEVFNLPAKASDTWNDGDTLYWNPNNGWLTSNGETAGVVLAGASVPMSDSVAGQRTVTAGKAAGVTSANVELIDHNAEAIIPQAAITQAGNCSGTCRRETAEKRRPPAGTGAAAGECTRRHTVRAHATRRRRWSPQLNKAADGHGRRALLLARRGDRIVSRPMRRAGRLSK